MADSGRDTAILRDLAKRVAEITQKDIQNERRDLWRRHNSLIRTRPLVYVRAYAWHEIFPGSMLRCEDPVYRRCENYLQEMIYRDTLDDDYIIEPWITVNAVYDYASSNGTRWGLEVKRIHSSQEGGADRFDNPIKEPEDIEKMVAPHHIINEETTAALASKVGEAIGDILEVNIDRGPAYRMWNADISTELAQLRGLEQIMWDMFDQPVWLHRLVAFMRDGVLTTHEEAEKAGDWHLCDHQNQAMPYAMELADPKANGKSVNRSQLWGYMASQEFAQVSPEMFEEFLLRYQIPILEKFGLAAYGCCEDLTRKIKYLKKIPNLRRIAVTPWANTRECAEQIGEDYVLSWRPSPTDMVCAGFDPARVRAVMKEAFAIFKEHNSHFDITLKDVETVEKDPDRVREWVKIVRSELENF